MPFNDSFLIKKLKHRRVILFIRIIISFSGIQFAKNELGVKMKHKIFNDLFVLNPAKSINIRWANWWVKIYLLT